jgi:diguanylate cyclase (GGDEF)-like protein
MLKNAVGFRSGEPHCRETIAHAIAASATMLASAEAPGETLRRALGTLGETLQVDGLVVVDAALTLRGAWHSPAAPAVSANMVEDLRDDPEIACRLAPLSRGSVAAKTRATARRIVAAVLDRAKAVSTLLVPVTVDGRYWGYLGLYHQSPRRTWARSERLLLRQLAGMIGAALDRRRDREQLAFSNLVLHAAMESSPDGIIVVDPERRLVSSNERFCEIWRVPRDVERGGAGRSIESTTLAHAAGQTQDPQAFGAQLEDLYAHPDQPRHSEIALNDGRVLDCHGGTLTAADGQYLGHIWRFRDVTGRKRAEEHAVKLALYDAVTGLANRRSFMDRLTQELARSARGGPMIAVHFLDLDHFKDVNDTLGHPVGDKLLTAVAERLTSNLRAGDTIARFGGDEFAILQTDVKDQSAAMLLAGKLIEQIAVPYTIDGHEIRTAASIGVVVAPGAAVEAEELLRNADTALYQAKDEGRGIYRLHTEAMGEAVRERVRIANDLRRALDSDEFVLEYQPQVSEPAGARLWGLEALVRWQHPARGLLMPGQFLPVAESTGLIVSLDRWVLRAALRQIRQWIRQGLKPVRVAVNLSSAQFKTQDLEDELAAALAEFGVPAQYLEIEITESALIELSERDNALLRRLRDQGWASQSTISGPGIARLPISVDSVPIGSRSHCLLSAACFPTKRTTRSLRQSSILRAKSASR